jgi:hypothetical protein
MKINVLIDYNYSYLWTNLNQLTFMCARIHFKDFLLLMKIKLWYFLNKTLIFVQSENFDVEDRNWCDYVLGQMLS